jgi:radical SAM superfamily enzyme YgiQ (UPF0313 family)
MTGFKKIQTFDVVLFATSPDIHTPQRTLGVYRIAHLLRQQGFKVKVVDFIYHLLKDHKEHLFLYLEEICSSHTLFGFSTTFFVEFIETNEIEENLKVPGWRRGYLQKVTYENKQVDIDENLMDLFDFLKTNFDNAKIIMGGYGGASRPIFNQCPIDHWIMGYAEEFTVSTINQILAGDELPKIINVTSANWNFRESGSCFDIEDNIFSGETLPIELSRGCVFKCKFCSFPLLGRKPDDKYLKEEDCIFNEMMHNYEHFGTTNYLMMCDTFNESTHKLLNINSAMNRFKRETGESMRYGAYVRLDLLERFPEQIEIMGEMGVKASHFGIESLHYPSAKSVGKGLKTEKIYKTLEKCRDTWPSDAIMYSGFIIGLPHETKETATEWCNILLNRQIPLTCWKLAPLSMEKDISSNVPYLSEFDRNAENYGYDRSGAEWTNEHWSFSEAKNFAEEWSRKFIDNESYTSGHSWNSVIRLSKHLNQGNKKENAKIFYKEYMKRCLWDVEYR